MPWAIILQVYSLKINYGKRTNTQVRPYSSKFKIQNYENYAHKQKI